MRVFRLARGLHSGDYVEVRGAEEIMATLDADGCVDALPFMPEMLPYCGRRFRVLKRVDKVMDMVHRTGLRRMARTVLLDTVRCDGGAHGGCQAGCQLLWKDIWLRRIPAADGLRPAVNAAAGSDGADSKTPARIASTLAAGTSIGSAPQSADTVYRCQTTEMPRASSHLPRWDLLQYLLPLWFGNVTLAEFLSFVSLKLFNLVQKVTGGPQYPHWTRSTRSKTPTATLGLHAGDIVYVRTREEIQQTLDANNRNRGLWFDHEMLRFCGGRFSVLRRVERLIDEPTGRMRVLTNPCIILDGVTTHGEFHRFYPQNDYPLWREIWLRRP